jgi:hypothetical protein
MRINEILIESQLNEEILTELDWSKIKKGLATGAITLGALGISGNAMAQHFKVDNASKIKDSQVVKYVQNKVDTGEIKPAVVKQAVLKVDAAPEVTAKAPETKQVDNPEVKKIDEPKKAAPDELDTVKKNAGIEKSQSGKLSSFSIKGLQFGMSLEQVVGITKSQEYGKDGNKKSVGSWGPALDDFTIAGETKWEALTSEGSGWETESKSATLEGLYTTISPKDFEDIVSKFTKQYGKPNIDRSGVRNKMNFSDINLIATWKVKDTTITIEKYSGKFTEGLIVIASDKYYANSDARSKSKKDKASKDF